MKHDRRIGASMAAQWRRDTVNDIAARRKRIAAGEQANRETHERYPALTAENVAEALAFQERRINELLSDGR